MRVTRDLALVYAAAFLRSVGVGLTGVLLAPKLGPVICLNYKAVALRGLTGWGRARIVRLGSEDAVGEGTCPPLLFYGHFLKPWRLPIFGSPVIFPLMMLKYFRSFLAVQWAAYVAPATKSTRRRPVLKSEGAKNTPSITFGNLVQRVPAVSRLW